MGKKDEKIYFYTELRAPYAERLIVVRGRWLRLKKTEGAGADEDPESREGNKPLKIVLKASPGRLRQRLTSQRHGRTEAITVRDREKNR